MALTVEKPKHIHKLRRHNYKTGGVIYFCCLPDCSYKINPSLAVGKRTLCHRCETPFIMNEYSIRLAKPHCDECHQPRDRRDKPKNSLDLDIDLDKIKEEIAEFIPSQQPKSIADLRSRLSSVVKKVEGEEEENDI